MYINSIYIWRPTQSSSIDYLVKRSALGSYDVLNNLSFIIVITLLSISDMVYGYLNFPMIRIPGIISCVYSRIFLIVNLILPFPKV